MESNGTKPDFSRWLVQPEEVDAGDMPWPVEYDEVQPDGSVLTKERILFPQKGRKVWIVRSKASGLEMVVASVAVMMSEVETLKRTVVEEGSPAEQKQLDRLNRIMQDAWAESNSVFAFLSNVVAGWDLLGWDGDPLPQPHKNIAAFKDLPNQALQWLSGKIKGEGAEAPTETAEEVGKGGKSSPSPAKATAEPPLNSSSPETVDVTG